MEPLRLDTSLPAEALTGTERDARIERLLLAGLDEYFAGQYEQAINLWTRVLFLDRHHDRARAYIERARSAQAELQRESEAVLHQGIEAFHEGDVRRARQLVADALHRGASRDDAQGLLDRIERLGAGQKAPVLGRTIVLSSSRSAEPGTTPLASRPFRVRGLVAALLLIAAGIGVLVVGFVGFTLPDPARWPIFGDTAAGQARSAALRPEPLPLAAASERFLSRGRALQSTGRLRDALLEIDRIPVGDPLRADADRLRADIQRQLLAVAAAAERPLASQSLPVTRPPE